MFALCWTKWQHESLGRAGDRDDRAVAVCHCEHSLAVLSQPASFHPSSEAEGSSAGSLGRVTSLSVSGDAPAHAL